MLLEEMDSFVFAVAFFALITGRAGENIALNKPTLMRGENGESERAVDGGYNQDYYAGSCAFMSTGSDPVLPYLWWIVDLQAVYDISHVIITRRSGFNAANLFIEMYNHSPILCASEALLCKNNPGELQNPNHNLTCAPGSVGRFLMVRRANAATPFTLCEVEVYGTFVSEITVDEVECPTDAKLDKEADQQLSGDVVQGEATSRVACSIECMGAGKCAAYSFNTGLAQCIYAVGELVLVEVIAKAGWDTYRIC